MYSVNIWYHIKFNKDILNIYECHKKKNSSQENLMKIFKCWKRVSQKDF